MNSICYAFSKAHPNANVEVHAALKQAAKFMAKRDNTYYWLSDEGQNELLRQIDIRNKKRSSSLDMFDYTADTKAMLSSAAISGEGGWIATPGRATPPCRVQWPSTSPFSCRCSPSIS